MSLRIGSLLVSLAFAAFGLLCQQANAEQNLDFNRDIRPILSENCFVCHGPDAQHQEAGLRLDLRQAAIASLDSGATAIVPGQAGPK